MKLKLSTVALLLFCCNTLMAQDKPNEYHAYIGINATPYFEIINLNHLNERLKQFNYPQLSNNNYSSSVGMVFMFPDSAITWKNFVYETADFTNWQQITNNSSGITSQLSILGTTINVNLNYGIGKKFYITPVFGVSMLFSNFKLINKNAAYTNFDSMLVHVSNETEMNTKNIYWLINAGAGITKRFRTEHHGGFLLTLNGGYHLQVNNAKWNNSNNQRLSDFPKINIGGFFTSLTVGIFLFNVSK